jgi:hypothetical protein
MTGRMHKNVVRTQSQDRGFAPQNVHGMYNGGDYPGTPYHSKLSNSSQYHRIRRSKPIQVIRHVKWRYRSQLRGIRDNLRLVSQR